MSGHTDNLAEADNSVPSPDLRATVRGEQLVITDWGNQLAGPAGLRVRSTGDSDQPAPTIVDLAALGDEREELMVMHYDERQDLEEVERVIVRWAGQVGYRRVWLAESVVEVEFPKSETLSAHFRCPTCSAELSGDSADFWLAVRRARMFPPFCLTCGVESPQWEVRFEGSNSSPPQSPLPASSTSRFRGGPRLRMFGGRMRARAMRRR